MSLQHPIRKQFNLVALWSFWIVGLSPLASHSANSCQALFTEPAPKVIDSVPRKPVLKVEKEKIKLDPVPVNMGQFDGDGTGYRVIPDRESAIGRYALALSKRNVSVILSENAFAATARSIVAPSYGRDRKVRVDQLIVLKPSAVTTSIIGHEGFHALNASKTLDDQRTSFNGVLSLNHFREYIQPKWKNKNYIREGGAVMSGDVISERFRSSYESIDEEEVHTFVKQLVQRSFINHHRQTLELIKKVSPKDIQNKEEVRLKTEDVILRSEELDVEIIAAEFFVQNFEVTAQKASAKLSEILSEESAENIGKRLYPNRTEVGQAKRKVQLNLSGMEYGLENLPQPLYDSLLKHLSNREYAQITSEIFPYVKDVISKKVITATNLKKAFEAFLSDLEAARSKNEITASEYMKLKNSAAKLGMAVSSAPK